MIAYLRNRSMRRYLVICRLVPQIIPAVVYERMTNFAKSVILA